MSESPDQIPAYDDGELVESLRKDALSSVIAISMSLVVIFASSITIIYIWKGEDGFVIQRPSSALLSWQMDYMDIIGINNDSVAELDGRGVVVCVVDSGVDLDHPDLRGVELRGWRDSINGIDEPYDDEGHGTAMTGIIVSDGGLDGVAKGVDLLVAKAINEKDFVTLSSLLRKSANNLLLVSGLLFLLINLNLDDFYEWFNLSDYKAALEVVLIVSVGKLFTMSMGCLNNIIINSKYYYYVFWFSTLSAIMAVILNLYLIKWYGIIGAALSTAIALIILSILRFIENIFILNLNQEVMINILIFYQHRQ